MIVAGEPACRESNGPRRNRRTYLKLPRSQARDSYCLAGCSNLIKVSDSVWSDAPNGVAVNVTRTSQAWTREFSEPEIGAGQGSIAFFVDDAFSTMPQGLA
jgi:hypothetical protein